MRQFTILLLATLLFASCSKDDDSEECPQNTFTNPYFPMNTGNYWVYEVVCKDEDGIQTGNTRIDSLIVVGDSLINGISYKVFEGFMGTPWIYRDSLGYIVSNTGRIVLPPGHSDEIFYSDIKYIETSNGTITDDTLFVVKEVCPSIDVVNTNFGSESCLLKTITHETGEWLDYKISVDSAYYANFGAVQLSYSYSAGVKCIGTLVDYHLE